MRRDIFLLFFIPFCVSFGKTWISGNHQTEYANYYLGISEPNISRNDALNDALSNALERAGIEKSVINIESVRRTVTHSLSEQRINNNSRSTFGQSKSFSESEIDRQFSSQIQKMKIMEEYFDGELGYVLIRIPKQGYETFDFMDWNENENRKRKRGGLYRSLAFPGWGQFYQNKKLRGTLMVAGILGSGGLIATSLTQYNQAISNKNKSVTADDKIRFYDKSIKFRNLYYTGFGLAGTVYLLSLLDTYLFPGEWQDYYYRKSRPSLTVQKQSKYTRILSVSTHNNIPIRADINEAFGDEDISAINSIILTFNILPITRSSYDLSIFLLAFEKPSNYFSILEGGISFNFYSGQRSIFGFYPSASIEFGLIYIWQNWEEKDDLINSFDLGYGFQSEDVSSSNFTTRTEIGFHRWFGGLDVYVQFGYLFPITFDSFAVVAYDGGTDKKGNKTTESITIPPENLPYSSLEIGGLYFSLGISFGLERKINLKSALESKRN